MYGRILVAVDGTRTSGAVLHQAVRLALDLDVELCTITVQERVRPLEAIGMEVEVSQAMHDEHFEEVEYYVRSVAEEAGVRVGTMTLVRGEPASRILHHIEETGFDFVVLGRRGGGLMHRLRWSSTAHKVMACSPCPVLVSPYSCEPVNATKSKV